MSFHDAMFLIMVLSFSVTGLVRLLGWWVNQPQKATALRAPRRKATSGCACAGVLCTPAQRSKWCHDTSRRQKAALRINAGGSHG
jgi:hypothetical protein